MDKQAVDVHVFLKYFICNIARFGILLSLFLDDLEVVSAASLCSEESSERH
jgi:hypothetical protein